MNNNLKKSEKSKIANTKNDIHANISARFAAFEARKQRSRELRSQLNRLEQRKIDETFSTALKRSKYNLLIVNLKKNFNF